MRQKVIVVLVLCAASVRTFSFQPDPKEGSARSEVVPGQEYDAGWLHRFVLGSNWRDLWMTPVSVEVLDLRRFAGGLAPTKQGGGKQTKSLRLKGGDGRQYKFRSMNKDARQSLPEDLQESIAGDFLQDQISSQNPAAAAIAAPLLTAVGVLNAEPRMVLMPKDSALGEFQEEFGGVLGTIEENPRPETDSEPGFAGEDKDITTFDLFKRLEKDHDERVDAGEFLKARLMDIYLGDWDRHSDQWRWAGFREGKGKWVWRPIPRDRDWAFTRFWGLVPQIAEKMVPELKGFGDSFPDIEGLTWKGRHLDRRLLVSLDKPAWDSIARFVVSTLTDSVIKTAVRRFPPEMYVKEGRPLETALKLRRTKLRQASDEFYALCAKFPDIRASNKSEFARVNYSEHAIRVALYRRRDEAAERSSTPFYERIFSDEETKDIRLYLMGGDDKAVVSGIGNSSTTVRVVCGRGKDEIIDSSESGIIIYDAQKGTTNLEGSNTSLRGDGDEAPANDTDRFEPHFRDYGHQWKIAPWIEITPDYGLFIGGGPILYDYGFRAHPEVYRMELRAGVATTAVRFRLDYRAELFRLVPAARVSLSLRASQIETSNFFGYGNESPFSEELLRQSYYRVHQQQVFFQPTIDFPLWPVVRASVGGRLKYVATDLRDGSFLQASKAYGSEKNMGLASILGAVTIDTRDNSSSATRGIFFDVQGSYFPRAIDNESSFRKLQADARMYLTAGVPTDVTLAFRIAGEKVWGDLVPFFELPSIGGYRSVRGYDGQRFTGDASALGSAEGRVYLGKFSLLVPVMFGVLSFADAGKVYRNGETSDLWHSSFGGGLWFSFIKRENVFNISVAHSHEKTGIYLAGGFMF